MKKLLLSLMVLATLASCGKDNKVSSGAAAGAANSAITITDQVGIDLGSKIDNYTTQFGVGTVQLNYYQTTTYQAILNYGLPLKFHYTKSAQSATSSNGQTCEKKWGIFYVCTYSNTSSGSTSGVAESRSHFASNIDVGTKIAELKAIINNANPLYPIQSSGYASYIRTRDGKQYVIDLRYPLQANPIGIMDSTGTEYLFNITEN